MSKIERLFFEYFIEWVILGVVFLIALTLSMFGQIYELQFRILNICTGIFILALISHIVFAKINCQVGKKTALYNILTDRLFWLFLCICSIAIPYYGKKDYTFFILVIIAMLWITLHMVVVYRRYLIINSIEEKNKKERLFFKYSVEFLVLGIVFLAASLMAFISSRVNPDYDFERKIFISIAGGLVSIPMFYVAILNNLRWAKIICITHASIVTLIALFLAVYELSHIYAGGAGQYIVFIIAGILLITNATLYRSYMNLKYSVIS
jgi:hypothetical protein